ALLPHRMGGLRARRDRLGAPALLRAHLSGRAEMPLAAFCSGTRDRPARGPRAPLGWFFRALKRRPGRPGGRRKRGRRENAVIRRGAPANHDARPMEAQELTDLIRRHAGLIHRVAHAYCRNAADREDVVQEVAVALWRSRHRYDERWKETTWVYRIAFNVAISFHR